MTEQWFYALDQQRLGPVSFLILQQFAASGQLKPSDLVWTTGMSEWVPASTVAGLVPAQPQSPPHLPSHPASPPPSDGSTFYDEPPWQREPMYRPRPRLNTAAKTAIALGLAAAVGVVIAVVVGIAAVHWPTTATNPVTFNLRTGEMRTFRLTFEGGKKAQIWVTSERDTDVDLFVCHPGVQQEEFEDNFVVKDDRMAKDCYVEFTPATTQTYQVVVWNRVHFPPAPHLEGPNRVTLKYSEEK